MKTIRCYCHRHHLSRRRVAVLSILVFGDELLIGLLFGLSTYLG